MHYNKEDYEKLLKGTTTIGIVCLDGVVMAADKRATEGTFIASSETRKVWKIDSNLVMTIAGGLGDAQELIRILKAQNEIYKMNESKPLSPKSATSMLATLLQENRMYPFFVGLLIGGIDGSESQLFSMDPVGGYTQESKFASIGSGESLALGYLEDHYEKNITTKEAVKLAVKALLIAMKRDSATGDGMIVATITKSGYIEYTGKDIEKLLSIK
ncbi:MAG: proteasome subunit beta [Candidatus Marsarchaeota archaeon]|jgi:proteasome beta subunit|nr:proteasome subunit beta [Candidatus Marsarchaeota archaeon]